MSIDAGRERIDAIDDELLRLLNQRLESVVEIGRLKSDRGQPIIDPEREAAIVARLLSANEGPLDDSAVRRIFETIIEEMRRLESAYAHSGDSDSPSR